VYLIQVLLPLYDETGEVIPAPLFRQLRNEFVDQFGGVTIYSSAPAEGLWQDESGTAVRDRIILIEVMADNLDRAWWHDCRKRLERLLGQRELVIRAQEAIRL
jgi:hypothetical protein